MQLEAESVLEYIVDNTVGVDATASSLAARYDLSGKLGEGAFSQVWRGQRLGGGEPCAQGEDCGGQERTECGTACPSICGEAPAAFCVRMCVIGFQCPSNLFWDPGTNGAGSCVAEADCSVSGR